MVLPLFPRQISHTDLNSQTLNRSLVERASGKCGFQAFSSCAPGKNKEGCGNGSKMPIDSPCRGSVFVFFIKVSFWKREMENPVCQNPVCQSYIYSVFHSELLNSLLCFRVSFKSILGKVAHIAFVFAKLCFIWGLRGICFLRSSAENKEKVISFSTHAIYLPLY